jgi:hypothetical protein
MGTFDFNSVDEQSFDVIPDGTIVVVQLKIREGNAGENGLLTRSKNGKAEGLDCEFTVVEGPHTKRKIFGFYVLSGVTDGHAQAADITKRRLRAILESARGIKPADVSDAAKKARVAEYRDFAGICFMTKLGIEPAKGDFKAKNILASVITPDMKEWHPIEQIEQPLMHSTPNAGGSSGDNPLAIEKPKWAK